MKKNILFIAIMLCAFVQNGISGNKPMYGPAQVVLGDTYEAVAAKYDNIADFNEGYSVVLKGEKSGLIDNKGAECIPAKYAYLGKYSDGLMAVREQAGSKIGYINLKEKMVIAPQYETVSAFYKGISMVSVSEDSIIAINKKGKFQWALPKGVRPCGEFSCGWAMVKKGEVYTFISTKGEIRDYEYRGLSSYFFQTGDYELPQAVAFALDKNRDYWYLVNTHGYALSQDAYREIALTVLHSEKYISNHYTGADKDEKLKKDIAFYTNEAKDKDVAQLLINDLFDEEASNYIYTDDNATPSLERKQKVQNVIEGIIGTLIILAFIAMIIHMILILLRERDGKLQKVSVEIEKTTRREAGLPEQMTDAEIGAISDSLDRVYRNWPEDKNKPEDHYPRSKQDIQNGMDAVQQAIDSKPTDPDLVEKINAWVDMMNEYNSRVFTGNKVFIVLNGLLLALFVYLAISDGGSGEWLMPFILAFVLGGYILSAYEPTFITLKKEMRKGGRGKGFLGYILGSLAMGVATAKTYKTITTYEDGHKETSTDNSETWIRLVIALIVSVILVMLTFVFAFYNYLRNYVLYK